jgi:hypothetical protein
MLPQDPPAFAALEWPGDVRDAAAGSSAWIAAAAAVLAALVVALLRRRARAPAVEVVPAGAATALARLRALALPAGDAAIAAFYAQLKALVRLHCRERFGVRAETATSEELVRAVPERPGLATCLASCDLVLFGARHPGATEHAASHASAVAFAADTSGAEVAR